MQSNEENKNNNIHRTFDDIDHVPLRVYNRVVYMFNLRESVSEDEAKKYASVFKPFERTQMWAMMNFIKVNGVEKAKALASKNMELQKDAG